MESLSPSIRGFLQSGPAPHLAGQAREQAAPALDTYSRCQDQTKLQGLELGQGGGTMSKSKVRAGGRQYVQEAELRLAKVRAKQMTFCKLLNHRKETFKKSEASVGTVFSLAGRREQGSRKKAAQGHPNPEAKREQSSSSHRPVLQGRLGLLSRPVSGRCGCAAGQPGLFLATWQWQMPRALAQGPESTAQLTEWPCPVTSPHRLAFLHLEKERQDSVKCLQPSNRKTSF